MIIQELKIRGMICSRCLKVLTAELNTLGAKVVEIELGRLVIEYDPLKIYNSHIDSIIQGNEFEIIRNKESILVEQIKQRVIQYLWQTDSQENLSEFLQKELNLSYQTLSRIFSKECDKTIERYRILLLVERTKELIENGDLSFSEIAYTLGYQNPSALSRLFKVETGMTLKEYKQLGKSTRVPLDKI